MADGPGDSDLSLRILRVAAAPDDAQPGALRVRLETTRGIIEGILHPVEGGSGAAIMVGGAMGGMDGPADALFRRSPESLAERRVTVLRLDYRRPNDFEECVLDVLAGCSFLKGIGASDVVLVGHSFGGAVVIKAGELAPIVRAVAALAPQLYGTRQVENLGKPLLLVHGTGDTVLAAEASEDIYRRALEPKQLVLYDEAGHSLFQCRGLLEDLLVDFIPGALEGVGLEPGRFEVPASEMH